MQSLKDGVQTVVNFAQYTLSVWYLSWIKHLLECFHSQSSAIMMMMMMMMMMNCYNRF